MKTKSKLTKIWGVGLTFILLAMLIGAALPVSAATLGWSSISAPGASGNLMVEARDVDFLVVAPDGVTMFAYSNASVSLYKSTNGGTSWGNEQTGGITGPAVALVAMAISPNYANDLTVVGASDTLVYRSINGGVSFGTVASDGLETVSSVVTDGTKSITSLDIGTYYLGGQPAIMVGIEDADATQFGGVYVFRTDTIAWADQALTQDVWAVSFSPNHRSDAQILAVGQDTADVILSTKFAGNVFGADVSDAVIAIIPDSTPLTAAAIAFADDYEWSSNNHVLVGISSGHATLDDAFRVAGRQVPSPATVYDLDVNGSADTDVFSIAANGPLATADVLVGQSDSTNVKRTADVTASVVTWRSSVKAPPSLAGTPNVIVLWSPTGDGTAYAGVGNSGGAEVNAVSRSTDGGAIWNGIGLISVNDISDSTTISYVDSATVDANTMFLIVADSGAAANAQEMLFRTTNGGSSWERVLVSDDLLVVSASPDYANDQTVYVAESSTRLWKSTNGGESFVGLTSPAAITAFTLVDKDTYFIGTTGNDIYMSGRWYSGALAGAAAVSIAVSPNFAADDTIIVGDADGRVWQAYDASATNGANFIPRGSAQELGAGANVLVAFDPGYADNKIIYAGSSLSTIGVNRFEVGTSAIWEQLDTGSATTTTSTVGADAFSITLPAIGDDVDIQQTNGGVSVAATTGTPTIAFAAGTWTVTAIGAGDVVSVTAIAAGTSGILSDPGAANSATLPVALLLDADSDATIPTGGVLVGGATSFILPDTAGTTTATTGALVTSGMVISADNVMYVANSSANSGIRREVWPTGPTVYQTFESLTMDLSTDATLQNLQVISGSNVLYAIAGGIAFGSVEHNYRILTYTDTMTVTPVLVGPKDGTATPSTSVTLSWKALESPRSITYTYDVATDADFANRFVDSATTTGTSVTVTGHNPGTKYYWRVRATTTPRSKRTAPWTYTPALSSTGTTSLTTAPSPGAVDVSLRPTFQWGAVAGATSYEMEFADNPFFANASVKKPLTHTTWTWDTDLDYSTTYYWRVRAVKSGRGILTNMGSWSEASFTTMDKPAPPTPPAAPPQITVQPAPPAPPAQVTIPAAPPSAVTPAVIWAIIIIGAVLVIAVIVLIVRTRRVA